MKNIKEILLKTIKIYENFFDKKIKNSTIVVVFICSILFGVVFFINNMGKINLNNSLQANILQTKKIKVKNKNFIQLDGKIYKLVLIKEKN